MISGEKSGIVFTMPDPKRADMLASARPPEVRTAADRDGTGIVVSISQPQGTMLIDNSTPFDADKIERIRREISNGAMKIDSTMVADRMLSDQKGISA